MVTYSRRGIAKAHGVRRASRWPAPQRATAHSAPARRVVPLAHASRHVRRLPPTMHGVRSRVVNGKRTDLTTLLMGQFQRNISRNRQFGQDSELTAPQLFQGHTRFATSSISDLGGCHPHQWLPAARTLEWRYNASSGEYEGVHTRSEAYITHNGVGLACFRAPPTRHQPGPSPAWRQATSISSSYTGSPIPWTTCGGCWWPRCTATPPRESTLCASRDCSICIAPRACGSPPYATAGCMAGWRARETCAQEPLRRSAVPLSRSSQRSLRPSG